ncbi:alanine--tRNA ligase [Amphiplicatus metriothermophilus]|uniref:Alanine--tRNA ligase n=1 Tax=Amphiplicatus metriothermophilus TaxID=1519374 RepID=A0A239PU65_9PROT|nr:alanine--tRNA ligase [Amphiplicatus metriothermophilus]MBB5519419.1 alanyl-tRNA synthetase [Amphiplicatus metriothermophilus]SNT73583.1 alanyl-tRNA synthetase [Amphiplicatus metriothermophilus]
MTSLKDIRSAFLDFFAARGHAIAPSAPLVPQNDPTLLFVNAGMVPFKNVFTGAEKRPYARAASSQKCVRAGGKHNDLDNVGYTARHHTFFEMLGNFSFGDYFKAEAIEFAWTLVTGDFALPKDKLWVTVYHADDEAFGLWRKISGLPEERIVRIQTSDNFWAMGDTGPCGPCSEIFYDHGSAIPGGPPGSADADGDRFIEIWNLVFMQFERHADGTQTDLPKPSIDTGMGLERIAAVLQGVHDNYDIDLFRTLIDASVALTGRPATGEDAPAHRVIADHLRAASFLIADGVTPSNEGRGYVLRRIMRRAMRYAHGLGAREPLLARLAPTLADEMGGAYPELARAQPLIVETLRVEEEKFRSLLERGLKLLDEEVARLKPGEALPGEAAFRLYDTYGFPLDLTQDALRRQGRAVDVAGFDAAMAAQKAAARAAWAGSGDEAAEAVWFDLREKAGASEFVGYVHDCAEGVVQAIVKDGAAVERARAGEEIELVVNQTPFYAESGGQVGDAGRIAGEDGLEIEIVDVKKRAGALFSHTGRVVRGAVKVGDAVRLSIDVERRDRTRANHSATHLLHKALRETLGDHVVQKGSLVAPDRLRFDFAHPKALTDEEIAEIERRVNAVIRQNVAVETRIMPYDDAVASGAVALFGEKYDDDVRVLSMGVAFDDPRAPYSVELCGGTHVRRTGDIALFKIVGEGAVAAGVRRIEALTGEAARLYLEEQAAIARAAADALKAAPAELPARIEALVAERRKLERALAEAKKQLALGGGGASPADDIVEVAGVKFLGKVLDGVAAKDLRGLVDQAKKTLGSGVAAFVAVNDGKAALAVGVTDDLKERLSAIDLVRAGAQAVGGAGGGGRPDMAQAGGPDGAKARDALKAIEGAIAA